MPKVMPYTVDNILLSNSRVVTADRQVETKILIGSSEYSIKLVLMKNWRYELLIGMDLLKPMGAIIICKDETLVIPNARYLIRGCH